MLSSSVPPSSWYFHLAGSVSSWRCLFPPKWLKEFHWNCRSWRERIERRIYVTTWTIQWWLLLLLLLLSRKILFIKKDGESVPQFLWIAHYPLSACYGTRPQPSRHDDNQHPQNFLWNILWEEIQEKRKQRRRIDSDVSQMTHVKWYSVSHQRLEGTLEWRPIGMIANKGREGVWLQVRQKSETSGNRLLSGNMMTWFRQWFLSPLSLLLFSRLSPFVRRVADSSCHFDYWIFRCCFGSFFWWFQKLIITFFMFFRKIMTGWHL